METTFVVRIGLSMTQHVDTGNRKIANGRPALLPGHPTRRSMTESGNFDRRHDKRADPQPGGRLLVIFDGHCVLCNRAVRWLMRRDRRGRFRFAASESPLIAEMLKRQPAEGTGGPGPPATILVVRNAGTAEEEWLRRSDAIVALLAELPGPWPAVGLALGLIPRPVRDFGYRVVAGWRYRIWGRLESCPLPTVEERSRFV